MAAFGNPSAPPTYQGPSDINCMAGSPITVQTSSGSPDDSVLTTQKLHNEISQLKTQVTKAHAAKADAVVNVLAKQVTKQKPSFQQPRDMETAKANAFAQLETFLASQESAEKSEEAKLVARLENLLGKQGEMSEVEDTRKPIKFKDCVGRKFSFPYHLCETWAGMESLIKQSFQHYDIRGSYIEHGYYDLLNSAGEILVASIWEMQIQPGMSIDQLLWSFHASRYTLRFNNPPIYGNPLPRAPPNANCAMPCRPPPPAPAPGLPIAPVEVRPPPPPGLDDKKILGPKKRSRSVSTESTDFWSDGGHKRHGFWARIKGFFQRKNKKPKSDDTDSLFDD